MGYSKKLYNVLGGVTSSIIAYPLFCVNTNDSQILQIYQFIFVHFHQYIVSSHLKTGRKLPAMSLYDQTMTQIRPVQSFPF